MASIKNISIKKVAKFKSKNGMGFQCDVYYGKEKIGNFNEWGDGGEPEFYIYDKKRYSEEEFYKIAQDYLKNGRVNFAKIDIYGQEEMKKYYDFGALIYDILYLNEYEKKWKQNSKNGYNYLIVFNLDGFKEQLLGVKNIMSIDNIIKKEKLDESKIRFVFNSKEDFIIN